MEGRYNLVRQHSGLWMSLRDGDFEEEVWAVLKDRARSPQEQFGQTNDYAPPSVSKPLPIAAKFISRANGSNLSGDSSLDNNEDDDKVVQQSATVSIPDWSSEKRIRKAAAEVDGDFDYIFEVDDVVDDDGGHCELAKCGRESDEAEEEDDEDFKYKLPPHELIARRLARSQISSSVFEGVGRTLKGRDLSKVRNAVLTKTGFLESL